METAMAPRVSFVTLPTEVIEFVLSLLYPLELVPFRQVSKLFRDLIDSSPELQLAIELIHDGLLLHHRGSPAMLPANVLMDHVLTRRRAWESLDPRSTWDEDCVDTANTQYEVSDGIWAHSFDRIGNGPFTGLKYRELAPPSSRKVDDGESGDESRPWDCTIDHLGMNATDFSFNACHDVHILMEPIYNDTVRRMHFRQMSTNEVHPDAAAPYFDIFAEDCSVWRECQTIGYQNRVLLLFSEWEENLRNCAVMIIDWRLSKAVLPYTRVADAGFVSSHRILLLHLRDHQDGPCIDLHSLATESSPSTLLCRFHLPSPFSISMGFFFTHPGSRFGEDQQSSSSFGAPQSGENAERDWKATVRNQSPVHLAKLFTTDPRSEVLGCWLRGREDTEELFMVFMIGLMIKLYETRASKEPRSTDNEEGRRESKVDVQSEDIQAGDGAAQMDDKLPPEDEPMDEDDEAERAETRARYIVPECSLSFPWDEWGPDSSRCLPSNELVNAGFRTTAGSRMAVWDIGTTGFRVVRLAVLDFNPLPIRRAKLKKKLELASSSSQNGLEATEFHSPNTDMDQDYGEEDGATTSPVKKQNKDQTFEKPEVEVTDRLVIKTVTASTITRFAGSSVEIETRLPYRIFTLRWDFNYSSVFMDNTTLIGRTAESYHFFSFLPRFDEPEETTPLLGAKPILAFPLDLMNLQGIVENDNEDLEVEDDEESEDHWHSPDEGIDDVTEEAAQGVSTTVGDQFVEFDFGEFGLESLNLGSHLENSTGGHATEGLDEQQ